jgi:hypothetical protein
MRKMYQILRNSDLAIKHFLPNGEISLPCEKFLGTPIRQNANTHQEIQNIRQN